MATRPPRLRRPNTYFHVTSRGTNRWNIFLDDEDRHQFMRLLSRSSHRHRVDVIAYCLMGNHFHLVLYCKDPNLSAMMRDLKSPYGTYFNRRHGGTGGVFEGPYVEVPILADEQLMYEVRYVHRNPLDLNPNVSLADYAWSSHGIYLGLRPEPRFLKTAVVRELFGPNYRLEVETPRAADKVHNRVQVHWHRRTSRRKSPANQTPPAAGTNPRARGMSLADIRRAVAAAAGSDVVAVRPRSHNGLAGIAVVLAADLGGYTMPEIAEPYGYSSVAAVRMAARRARARIASDPQAGAMHDEAIAMLHRQAA